MFNKWIISILAVIVLSGCESVCETLGAEADFSLGNYPYSEPPKNVSITVNNSEQVTNFSVSLFEKENKSFLSIDSGGYMDPDKVHQLIIDGKLFEISNIKTYKSVRDWRCFINTFQVNSCLVQSDGGNIVFDYQCGVDK